MTAYRQFLESSGDILYTHDLEGRFLSLFGSVGVLGYSREELSSMSLAEIAETRSFRDFKSQLDEDVRSGFKGSKLHLLKARSKSGEMLALECNVQILWNKDVPVSVHGIARDKTRQWMAEQQLSEREEQFRTLAELAPGAAFIVVDEHVAWANRAAEQVSGYSAAELHGLAIASLVYPEDLPMVSRNARARLCNQDVPPRYEFRMLRKDGELRWVDFSAGLVMYEGQRGIFGTALDITAQKHAEVAMRRSEELFRSVIESSADIITIISDEGTVRYGSPAIERVLGWTPEELIGTNAFALVHPEDVETALQGVRQGIEDYRKYPPVEVRVRHADGSYRWFEAASSHYFEGGERKGLVCSFRHLTDCREAEQVLRASESKYRLLFERNVAGVYLCRMDGRVLDCNDAAAKIFGFASREEMLHRNANDFYFSAHDRKRFVTLIEHFGSVTDLETKCKRVDGSPVWILENAVLYEAEVGGERLLQGTVLDITERKRSEELQSALYRTASLTNSSSPTGEYFNSLQRILADLMYAENMYVAILDLSHKRLVFRYFADEQDPNPGERALGRGLTEYILRSGAPLLADEQRTRELEDAGEIDLIGEPCIDWMGAPLRSNGEVIGVIALQTYDPKYRYSKRDLEVLTFVAQHISAAIERERNQQAVRDSEESHRSLVQSAVYGIYRSSVDDRFLEVNPALVKMLGYSSAEELLAIPLSERLYSDPEERARMIS
ncbi:MAG TPA: PAS domain S-box protein, partial [Terriglobales bacterium]